MKPFVMYGIAASMAMIVGLGSFNMGLARVKKPNSKRLAILLMVVSIPLFYAALQLSQESDRLKGVKEAVTQEFIQMAQSYADVLATVPTNYPGDLIPAGKKCGKAVVLVQGAHGKFVVSSYFDSYLPKNYQAKSVQELQTLILVKAVSEPVIPSPGANATNRTLRYFYGIDKRTSRVFARKYIALAPPASITRDPNGKMVEHYTPEVQKRNDLQLKDEKEFFQKLYR